MLAFSFLFFVFACTEQCTRFFADVKQYNARVISEENLCTDIECVRSAASIIERIDFDVDPCDNFYEFACGRYLQTKAVPDDHASRNILQEIQDEIYVEMKNYLEEPIVAEELSSVQKAKLFFASCMNETTANDEIEAMSVILNLIDASGGPWRALQTLSGNRSVEVDVDFERRLVSAFMDQVQSIFHFYVAQPERNSTGYAFHVS